MHPNEVTVEYNEHIRANWMQKLASYDRRPNWMQKLAGYNRQGQRSEVEEIASDFHGGKRCQVIQRFEGAFNYCFRLRFKRDHTDWLLRFPIPGDVMRPAEKINQEVAIMKFVREKTMIPIPKVIACGTAKGRFTGLGPFIIMEFIEGERLDEVLYQDDKIKPEIEQSTLNIIYKQMAQIYLELDSHDFDQIGGLSISLNEHTWRIGSAPLTLKMNEAQGLAGLDFYGHNRPYHTTTSYLEELVSQHTRLLCENPRAVWDEDECREEYRCLHSIKKLTKQLASSTGDNGPFKLFLDDLRFGNILVDPKTFEIKAIIDWEFCYSAPRQFLRAPPPWLIPNPNPWDWSSEERGVYRSCFFTFLRILQEEEATSGRDNGFSTQMQDHFEDGTFWYTQAVREPLCCLELMQSWSAEVGQPLETPVDTEDFVMEWFKD